MDPSALVAEVAVRRPIVTGIYTLISSLFGFATLVGYFHAGNDPLAQLGAWAEGIGWNSGATWLTDTATDAFATGAKTWSMLAAIALAFTVLSVGLAKDLTDVVRSRACSTFWLALAVWDQAGEALVGALLLWFGVTFTITLVRFLKTARFPGDGDVLAHAIIAPTFGLIAGPAGIVSWLVSDAGSTSDFDRGRAITRAVLYEKDEHDRRQQRVARGSGEPSAPVRW